MTSMNSSDQPVASSTHKPRRMAREPKPAVEMGNATTVPTVNAAKMSSKLDEVQELLLAPTGASIAELVAATGWQQHSVRGALAGALKKRGLTITSDKIDGVRRYRAETPT